MVPEHMTMSLDPSTEYAAASRLAGCNVARIGPPRIGPHMLNRQRGILANNKAAQTAQAAMCHLRQLRAVSI